MEGNQQDNTNAKSKSSDLNLGESKTDTLPENQHQDQDNIGKGDKYTDKQQQTLENILNTLNQINEKLGISKSPTETNTIGQDSRTLGASENLQQTDKDKDDLVSQAITTLMGLLKLLGLGNDKKQNDSNFNFTIIQEGGRSFRDPSLTPDNNISSNSVENLINQLSDFFKNNEQNLSLKNANLSDKDIAFLKDVGEAFANYSKDKDVTDKGVKENENSQTSKFDRLTSELDQAYQKYQKNNSLETNSRNDDRGEKSPTPEEQPSTSPQPSESKLLGETSKEIDGTSEKNQIGQDNNPESGKRPSSTPSQTTANQVATTDKVVSL